MRINHNIAALNTYRQLSSNTSATSKSLEKLSSGLRINRAGDDAAGLAISEKMRGQIRGLDQASRNSQDAISMIQTAEGALSETHSILQRMKELATQASNGTNTDADRSEIQKEMNQLTSELNRISNTTEFNTKKLLDGTISVTGDGKAIAAADLLKGTGITNVKADTKAAAAAGTYDVTVTSKTVAEIETNVERDSNVGSGAKVTSGSSVDLTGGAYKIAIKAEDTKQLKGAATGATTLLNTTNNNTPITLESNSTLNDVSHTLTVKKEQTASAISSGLSVTTGKLDSIKSGVYKVTTDRTVDATKLTDSKNVLADSVISNFKVSSDATATQAQALNSGSAAIAIDISGTANNGEASIKFTLGSDTVSVLTSTNTNGAKTIKLGALTFDVDVDKIVAGVTNLGSTTAAVTASGTYNAASIALGSDTILDKVSVSTGTGDVISKTAVSATGDHALTFDLDGGGDDVFLTLSGDDFIQGNTMDVTVQSQYTIDLAETVSGTKIGTSTVVNELQIASNSNALSNLSFGGSGALIDLSASDLSARAAGSSYTVAFEVETKAGFTAQLQTANGTAVTGAKTALDASATAGTTIDLGKDVVFTYGGTDLSGITDNGSVYFGVNANVQEFTFKLTNDGGTTVYDTVTAKKAGDKVDFKNGISLETDATLTASTNTTFKVEETTVDNSLTMQVGANSGQTFSIDIDNMGSSALGISTTASSTQIKGKNGAVAVGAAWTDTQTATDGTSNKSTEYALSVADATKASAAIDVISNAISKVSAERAKLGAFQNRLEHTINNLGTSSENLSAAESRIRDVDMAKEMMEFTKNNILSQASQAMLAQANQQPQGILQLLR